MALAGHGYRVRIDYMGLFLAGPPAKGWLTTLYL